jgi:hypothetical protein
MQLVGQSCGVCGCRIRDELGARFCSTCGCPVHHSCSREQTPAIEGRCPLCGSGLDHPVAVAVRQQKAEVARAEAEKVEREAKAPKGWRKEIARLCLMFGVVCVPIGLHNSRLLITHLVAIGMGLIGVLIWWMLEGRYIRRFPHE